MKTDKPVSSEIKKNQPILEDRKIDAAYQTKMKDNSPMEIKASEKIDIEKKQSASEHEGLAASMSALEEEKAAKDERIASLELELKDANNSLKAAKDEVLRLQVKLEAQEFENEKDKRKIATSLAEKENLVHELEDLKKQAAKLSVELKQKERELEAKGIKFMGLEEKILSLTHDLQAGKNELEKSRAEFSALKDATFALDLLQKKEHERQNFTADSLQAMREIVLAMTDEVANNKIALDEQSKNIGAITNRLDNTDEILQAIRCELSDKYISILEHLERIHEAVEVIRDTKPIDLVAIKKPKKSMAKKFLEFVQAHRDFEKQRKLGRSNMNKKSIGN